MEHLAAGTPPHPGPQFLEMPGRLTASLSCKSEGCELAWEFTALYVVASARTAAHILKPQLQYLLEKGRVRVVLVCSPGQELQQLTPHPLLAVEPLPLARRPAPLADLVALWRLVQLVRSIRPDIVNAATPKAGFLGTLASWLAGTPCRIYSLRGLRLETASGWRRVLLYAVEWITCHCAHKVVCVSPSVRARAIELGIANEARTCVVGPGSSNGADARRFGPTPENVAEAAALRATLGLTSEDAVIGFVGRLTRDKGIAELVEAFERLRSEGRHVRLLLVGDFEDEDPVPERTRRAIENDPCVIKTGFVANTAPYYHLMTMLVLPTYREGFPNVVLEAAVAGVPVVATRVTGVVDAVVEDVTGLLVPARDADALAGAMRRILDEPELAGRLADAARKRALEEFQPERIWAGHLELYRRVLAERRAMIRRRQQLVKRVTDVLGATLALALSAPVQALVWAGVRIAMGSPGFVRQERAGLNGRPFTLYKFRTMTEARDESGRLLPDEQRLTRLGRFLRRFSLDELPQLWNVLKGEMSLVGPRPLPVEYVPRYNQFQRRRLEVRPGMTGWAQINGRNALTWEQKFELDVWYVDHQSLWLDLKILLATVGQVLSGRGISHRDHPTMPEFLGAAHHPKDGEGS